MIAEEQIKHLISQGETTTVQFKIRSEDTYKMDMKMIAFSNTRSGILIIDVNDKITVISGLSFAEEIQQTNSLIVNQILSVKKENPAADTSNVERQIDRSGYGLYGLTEKEVEIVEQ